MKIQIISVFALFVSTSMSFAQTPSLKDNMKAIKPLVSSLVKAISDPTQNAASAISAGKLVALFTAALSQVPDSVSAMPAAQQADAIASYKSMIQQEIDDANALQNAFTNNDNTGAATLLQDMNTVKSKGHATFDP